MTVSRIDFWGKLQSLTQPNLWSAPVLQPLTLDAVLAVLSQ
jgi:hypothetical protein